MNQKELLIIKFKVDGIDKKVISAFEKIKREYFVLEKDRENAYYDSPLLILAEQTISQPSTIMIMLDALDLKETDKVLEIGAGSGYNAALMGEVCKKGKVITIECIKELAYFAKSNINKTGLKNIEVLCGDGTLGYAKEAPYDKIICTAGIPGIPQEWLDQLKENGIIVAPVGPELNQSMIKFQKNKKGNIASNLGEFRFVPARGKHGYNI